MTLDLETSGLDPWHDKILLIAYRYDGIGPVYQVKVYEHEKPNYEFLAYLNDPQITKRGHNVHFDLLFLVSAGHNVRGPIDDTRILAYLEDPSQELHLKRLVEKKLNRPATHLEDFGKTRVKKGEKDLYPIRCGKVWTAKEPLEAYNKRDVLITDELRKELVTTKWYIDVEQPLSECLFKAEVRGIQLDVPYLEKLKNELEEHCKEIRGSLGHGVFNPNSPAQVKEQLQKIGENITDTSAYTLKKLAWQGNEFASRLLGYRKLSKLLSTYVRPFLEQSVNGRLHGRFNQAGRESASMGDVGGTATGRLSSSDPNLQNIPSRSEEGKKVRKAIIASSGSVLIDSDLKQIEPRLIAHYSQSKVLLNAYEKGLDTHAIMGGLIFNKRPESLTKLERFIGKTSWLATVYGCWHKKLRQIVEMNSEEPLAYDEQFYENIQKAFWNANPEIAAWRERHLNEVRGAGYVQTIGGRNIKIPGLYAFNVYEKKNAERIAINYAIQGSAADIMKMIIVKLSQVDQLKLLATVHDEVLMESDKVECDSWYVHRVMCNTIKLKNVPIEADTKVLKSWADKN